MVAIRVNDDAIARRRRLGRLLRQARKDATLTQSAVAARLGCGQAKINKIERTLVAVSPGELDTLTDLYGLSAEQARELRELAELDQRDGPPRTKYSTAWSAYAELSDHEPEAHEILCWHSERIPTPLQSEPYRLRLHQARTSGDAVRVLSQLRARTQIFTMPEPPRYRVVLSESSLHRMPGGRSTGLVRDQAEHLLGLTEQFKQIELRILTFDADIPFVDSDFEILRFENAGTEDFTYIECPGGSRKFKTNEELKKFQEHWDLLNAAALDREHSRIFLRGLH
jgi:transcriptional regulator with XRE-family HTH domain